MSAQQIKQPFICMTTNHPGPEMMTVDQTQVVASLDPPVHQVVECVDPSRKKCAIADCPNPSYIDEDDRVHECCGKTHARELQQRQCKKSAMK